MVLEFINLLDLQRVFLFGFAGSTNIFIFLAIIAISALAGMFIMNGGVFAGCLVLFLILMNQYVGGLYILALILVGTIGGYLVGRLFNR